MQVWINGEPRELADGARGADALGALGPPRTGVAVAVDGEVVPRRGLGGTALADGRPGRGADRGAGRMSGWTTTAGASAAARSARG